LKQLSKEDLQAMVQQGRQELAVKAMMRVMTPEERHELLGRLAPEERDEILGREQREREEIRERFRLQGMDPDDPRPEETARPRTLLGRIGGKHGYAPSRSKPPKDSSPTGSNGASPAGRRTNPGS
jgi:hypothetical protein